MHEGQWNVTGEAVARLVAEQFPAWRDLPVEPVPSHGTVNSLFRVGDHIVVTLAGHMETLAVAEEFPGHRAGLTDDVKGELVPPRDVDGSQPTAIVWVAVFT